MTNCTILTLHIISNRNLHSISFQMKYNVAVCTLGTLNSPNNEGFFLAEPLDYRETFSAVTFEISTP